ncbi:hypothetical protein GGR57DRAFT_397462 [Xylariaceae sp. FL1272]|nr:hypothetical protein GGR57DRAFT_397462 [Xylariaceae sp. FL1272]
MYPYREKVAALRSTYPHRLNRSRLNLSWLLTRFTTPSLKNFSSPPAVRPPMYHLSAPMTSLKPSELLSLPRRRPAPAPGIGIPWRGECKGSWFITLPLREDVLVDWEEEEICRADEGVLLEVDVVCVCLLGWAEADMEGGCCRKAARKEERKKGRCDDGILVVFCVRVRRFGDVTWKPFVHGLNRWRRLEGVCLVRSDLMTGVAGVVEYRFGVQTCRSMSSWTR